MTVFESDGPVVFTLEEIEEATGFFDELKIIGEGGYGKVYFGVLGEKVWQNPTSVLHFYQTKPQN